MKQVNKPIQKTDKQKLLEHAAELWVNLIFAHIRHKKNKKLAKGGDEHGSKSIRP